MCILCVCVHLSVHLCVHGRQTSVLFPSPPNLFVQFLSQPVPVCLCFPQLRLERILNTLQL